MENRFSVKILNETDKLYRQYFFLNESDDIVNKIHWHAFNFLSLSEFSKKELLFKKLHSLCHKVNAVKYHLRRYEELEEIILNKIKNSIEGEIKEGIFFLEEAELTAEYESFLFQVKSALDILVGFLNPIYHVGHNHLKKQGTFENKGINVIKDIKKYLKKHPEKEKYLFNLLKLLEEECQEDTNNETAPLNWLLELIKQRDEVAHFRKSEQFAFQISNIGGNKSLYPPHLTLNQSMIQALKIAYDNLLTFVEDFIASLIGPYLNEHFVYFTFQENETRENSPKWYIMLRVFNGSGLRSFKTNPGIIIQYCLAVNPPLDTKRIMGIHEFYSGFYK